MAETYNCIKGLALQDDFLLAALNEDIGTGDITTDSCVPESETISGKLIAKETGIISGINVLNRVFSLLCDIKNENSLDDITQQVTINALVNDGDRVEKGDIIATIEGSARTILTGERTALNLLQHLSGIATKTAEAVSKVSGTKTKILDTRKTTPGLRALEKYAVTCGGGTNHRFNLADGVLIKDNHIKAAGSITNAVNQVRSNTPPNRAPSIEVETENLTQVEEALNAGADIIMLDNMTPEMMTQAVKLIGGRALTEASGNMGEKDLKAIAETGVDYISIGALTHSVKALDISLKF